MQMQVFINTYSNITVAYINTATYERETGKLVLLQGSTGWKIEMDEVSAKKALRELHTNGKCDLSTYTADYI